MTREEAVKIVYQIINTGILDIDLEEDLVEVCNCIADDSFEEEEEEEE